MNQAVFDLAMGEELKASALDDAENRKAKALKLGRSLVRKAALSRSGRIATADDAALGFVRAGLPADYLGNAAGALFREPCWEFTGSWIPSQRVSNHARSNRVWRLV